MRISACQMVSGTDPEQNVLDAINLIAASAESDAELIVLPEHFAMLGNDEDNLKIAETFEDGPIQEAIRMAAVRHSLWIVAGSIPLKSNDDTHYINASIVYNPNGDVAARYDRIHLFRYHRGNMEAYDERHQVQAGQQPVSFKMTTWDGQDYSVGLSMGFDLRFPELFRSLNQPDLIVLPATFTETTGRAHWATLLAARAIENQCYLVAAAQGGPHQCGRRTWGHSRLNDPWGRTMSELTTGQGIVIGDIDLAQIRAVREMLPALSSRVLYTSVERTDGQR